MYILVDAVAQNFIVAVFWLHLSLVSPILKMWRVGSRNWIAVASWIATTIVCVTTIGQWTKVLQAVALCVTTGD